MRVAVLGATGTVGRALVPALSKRHEVVAVSRRPPAWGEGVMGAAADVVDGPAVAAALRGVEVVYYLVHSLGSEDFEARDRLAAQTVAREAADAGVQRIVYLGGLGDDRAELSPHLRSREETRQVLAAGPVPVTTVRAAVVVGAGSAAFTTIVALVDRLPAMLLPRWANTPTQPIALGDVVAYLVALGEHPEAGGRTYDAGGPEVMTYREMIERIARVKGARRLLVEVPVLTPRLSSWWLHLVTPVNAAVARPLVDGLRVPTVAEDDALRTLVPLRLTPFDDAVREALAAEGAVSR